MARIQTKELLSRVYEGDFTVIKLKGLQDGSFYLLLETVNGSFILENADGSMKQYPRVDYALSWLKRVTNTNEVVVDIEIWRSDDR
jgi:hypothetical protein